MADLYKIIENVVEIKLNKPTNPAVIFSKILEPNEEGSSLFDLLKNYDTLEEFGEEGMLEDYDNEDQELIKSYYSIFKPGSIMAYTINDTDDMSTEDISKFKYCTTYGNAYNGVVLIFHNVPGI